MRLSDKQIGAIVRAIRESLPGKPSQKAFVRMFSAELGIADHTALSRFETGDRKLPREQLLRLVERFPDQAAAIKRHLDSVRPFVFFSKRLTEIHHQPDGSFAVRKKVETRLASDFYLYAFVQRQDDADQLTRAVPWMNGVSTMSPMVNMMSELESMLDFEPPTYSVELGDLSQSQHRINLSRLSRAEVTDLAPDIDPELLERCVFMGAPLAGPQGSIKRFYFDGTERRLATLYNYRWRAMRVIADIDHKVMFISTDATMRDSFTMYTFLPEPVVTEAATPTTVSRSVRAQAQLDVGHGWMVTWRNRGA